MNIFQKINEVMKAIEYLTKDDKVEFGNTKYKAISEEKVTTAVRKELVKQGIVIIPIMQESTVTELIRTDKSVNQRADVHTRYRIQNIDDVSDFILVVKISVLAKKCLQKKLNLLQMKILLLLERLRFH